MNIKNKTFLAIFSIFFIIGCSNSSTETDKDSASGPIYMGPFYNEFIACTPGDNYSDENAREMMDKNSEIYKDLQEDLRRENQKQNTKEKKLLTPFIAFLPDGYVEPEVNITLRYENYEIIYNYSWDIENLQIRMDKKNEEL